MNWEQSGNTITGDSFMEYHGYSIDLNTTGNVIAIGSPNYLVSNYGLSDRTRVFRNDKMLGVSEHTAFAPKLYPNPSKGHFTVDLGRAYSNVTIQIIDMLGKLIFTTKYDLVKTIEQEIKAPMGIYLVEVITKGWGSKSFKIIKN